MFFQDEYEKIIVRGGRKKTHFDVDVKFSNPSRRGGRGRGKIIHTSHLFYLYIILNFEQENESINYHFAISSVD